MKLPLQLPLHWQLHSRGAAFGGRHSPAEGAYPEGVQLLLLIPIQVTRRPWVDWLPPGSWVTAPVAGTNLSAA